MSGICLQAQDRPPIVTNTIYLSDFIWQNDLIGKDTLYYLRFDDANCFSTKGLNAGDVWEQHCFATPGDSTLTIFEGDSIWIVDGGTFTRNDSVFEVRRDPTCSICWDYKYSTDTEWKILFCENIATGRFLIGGTANDIFYMVYGGSFTNWQDYFFFHVDLADSNKVLTTRRDSTVGWDLIPVDSLFFEDTGKWLKTKDTIYNQRDSIIVEGVKYGNNDTIPVIDNSITNELDTVTINGTPLTNGSSIDIDASKWDSDTYGIHPKSGNIGIGTNSNDSIMFTLLAPENFEGINSIADNKTALYAQSTDYYGIWGYSSNSAGIYGSGHTSGIVGIGYDYGVRGTGGTAGIYGSALNDYSGYFTRESTYANKGVYISDSLHVDGQINSTKLQVGTGAIITRTGTAATYDFWYGTQAEWTANTPHDGIYPQAQTTIWHVKD